MDWQNSFATKGMIWGLNTCRFIGAFYKSQSKMLAQLSLVSIIEISKNKLMQYTSAA